MTNLLTAAGSTVNDFDANAMVCTLPLTLSYLLYFLSWVSILVVVISAVAISCRWIIRKIKNRNPNGFAFAILIQMLFFILFNTVDGIKNMCANIETGMPDRGMWCLGLVIIIGPLLWNILACMFSLTLVSLVARKLPVLPACMIFPLVVVLLDVAVLLIWTTHILI